LRRSGFEVGFNEAFDRVIDHCAEHRPGQDATWITPEMRAAYCDLHRAGWAHSIEVWLTDQLVGGLYGLAIDQVFFGESMFSREDDASKAALLALCKILETQRFALLDCQVASPHLFSLGASLMPRAEFAVLLSKSCSRYLKFRHWPAERRQIIEFMG
jgi:leucyl/phenylalanyl-tRNA--protein transferase